MRTFRIVFTLTAGSIASNLTSHYHPCFCASPPRHRPVTQRHRAAGRQEEEEEEEEEEAEEEEGRRMEEIEGNKDIKFQRTAGASVPPIIH